MTNPKTDHKIRKHTASDHAGARRAAAPAPESHASVSTPLVEACDRLGQKLDDITGLVRDQIEAWRQIRQPSAAASATPQAGPAPETNGPPTLGKIPPDQDTGLRAQAMPPGGSASSAPAGASEDGGLAAKAAEARQLADTLSRSRNGWQEQAAGFQQALEAFMAYLETQAEAAAPKMDVEGIMSRLRDLEERQQSLQSQFNTNRWG